MTRNPELVPGVRRYGAVAAAKRSATYTHTKKGLGKSTAKVTPPRADKMEGKFYAADDTKVALRSHRGAAKTAKLRKSIRAGTVVIVLAGRFRGKRVIVLKQLQSGLLLVTGQLRATGESGAAQRSDSASSTAARARALLMHPVLCFVLCASSIVTSPPSAFACAAPTHAATTLIIIVRSTHCCCSVRRRTALGSSSARASAFDSGFGMGSAPLRIGAEYFLSRWIRAFVIGSPSLAAHLLRPAAIHHTHPRARLP